jgi:hypothetical protein
VRSRRRRQAAGPHGGVHVRFRDPAAGFRRCSRWRRRVAISRCAPNTGRPAPTITATSTCSATAANGSQSPRARHESSSRRRADHVVRRCDAYAVRSSRGIGDRGTLGDTQRAQRHSLSAARADRLHRVARCRRLRFRLRAPPLARLALCSAHGAVVVGPGRVSGRRTRARIALLGRFARRSPGAPHPRRG